MSYASPIIESRQAEIVEYQLKHPNPSVPPENVTIILPGYTTRHEVLLSTYRKWSQWNGVQHYACSVLDVPAMSGVTVQCQFGNNPAIGIDHTFKHHLFGYDGAFGDAGRPINGLPAFIVQDVEDFIPDPSSFNDMQNYSLKAMLPLIKAELSAVNSIIELKDFKSLPKTILKMKSFAVKSGKTLREWLRLDSDAYLQAKFNILPLLSDIGGIYSALRSHERRLNDLITRQGRVQRRHYAFSWNEFTDSVDVGQISDIQYNSVNGGIARYNNYSISRRYVTYSPSWFHAEIEYNYNFTQYQLEHARVLALLDAFGVNNIPSIIWNALPWSFVVDWVIGVGRYLDNFKTSNMEPVINIRKYLATVSRERRILVTKQMMLNSLESYGPEVPMPMVVERSYKRVSQLPSHSSITSSGLNSNEFSLGAALVLSRRRRSSRPR